MAITKQKKQSILKEATEALAGTKSAVFMGFKGLTVFEATELRKALTKEGVSYKVVKKTLLSKALDASSLSGDKPDMPGEVALAYLKEGDDLTAPARNLNVFVKKFKEKLAFLGGVISGAYLGKSEIQTIATIPPTLVLRGMFVNIINSPIQRMAIALSEVAKSKA